MTKTKTKAALDPEAVEKLKAMAAKAQQARLNADEERSALELLKQCLAGGKAGIEAAVENLVQLPWSICVDAVSAVWPELKVTARRQLINGLAAVESEQARRQRMSIARALFAQDPDTSAKLIISIAGELAAQKEPSSKDRQNFANVFIGKSKPWLLNLPLAEWKGADAVASVALQASLNSAPFAQSWVLRWVVNAKKIGKVPEELIAAFAKNARRWQGRLKKETLAETPELPQPIAEALAAQPEPVPAQAAKPAQAPTRKSGEPQKPTAQETEKPRPEAAPEKPAPKTEPRDEREQRPEGQQRQKERAEQRQPSQREKQRHERAGRADRTDRTDRSDRTDPAFDLSRNLRQIEEQFYRLRSELQQAKAQSQKRERPQRHAPAGPVPEEYETLRRHNAQLEATVNDLRLQLDELSADHEERAAIMQQEGDPVRQFKSLLAVKLAEGYQAFQTLRGEHMSEVVRLSYRDILDQVFSLLEAEGVSFSSPPKE